MELKKLQIEMADYGPNKGRYTGKVYFGTDHSASVEIPLGDELSRRVLEVCADEVVRAGNAVAAAMTSQVIETINAGPLIEDQTNAS